MAFQATDQIAIERGGVLYRTIGSEVLAYIRANLGTSEYSVATIVARNAITGQTTGDIAYVVDATGDATVTAGWAVYMWQGTVWSKISEQEGIDVVAGGADLAYTASPTNGIVVSSTGTDATIPAGTGANAGLIVPAQFNKLGFIAITQAVDLDAVEAASHAAVTTAGTANNNPIVVAGQALSFSISNLTAAP